jgi:hypothetical protein
MKKKHHKGRAVIEGDLDEILPEYDFSRARPNKYAARYASRGEAAECTVELQGSVPLEAEAIFTLGFSGENAFQTFIAKMGNLSGRRL